MGQPTQRATNYTARSNIEPAQIFLYANGQSAPRSAALASSGRGAGSHTPSTTSESVYALMPLTSPLFSEQRAALFGRLGWLREAESLQGGRRVPSARGGGGRRGGELCLCVFCVGPLCGPPLRWWVLSGVLPSVWVSCGWGPPPGVSLFPMG